MGTPNTLPTLRTALLLLLLLLLLEISSMSWQTYVDTNLVGTGAVTQAAIIGHDGNTWATSAGFAVSPANGAALANAFKDATAIRSNGFELAGTRYVTIRANVVEKLADYLIGQG